MDKQDPKPRTAEEVRSALVIQWRALAQAVPALDLNAATRLAGWTNRELVAHLAVQPLLLLRFLSGKSPAAAELTVATNLAGTAKLAELIDEAARSAANAGRVDLASNVEQAIGPLLAADLDRNVVTLQGPIPLVDYLITRCVEAVIHGLDLNPPLAPDPDAAAIVVEALLRLLAQRAPELLADAVRLPSVVWLEAATGRRRIDGQLNSILPLMT